MRGHMMMTPKQRVVLVAAALAALALAGCYNPTYPEQYRCGGDQLGCPAGWTCDNKAGWCVQTPPPEAGADLPRDMGLEAGADLDQGGGDAEAGTDADAGAPCETPQHTKNCNTDSNNIEWCQVPPGCFLMGSPGGENCREPSNETQRQVTLTRPLEVQSTEVTAALFKAVLGYNPATTSCADCPVDNVNWHQAVAFCNMLSVMEGDTRCYHCTGSGKSVTCEPEPPFSGNGIYACSGYRLPTEAEWEYVYRAGTKGALYNGSIASCTDKDTNAGLIGWYDKNSGLTSHAAGQKAENAWGLKDMAGNVWEWCHDGYDAKPPAGPSIDPVGVGTAAQRVLRGGAFNTPAKTLRAAWRAVDPMTKISKDRGFRCVRSALGHVADDTFADFSKGGLSESGAKLYVAAQGNVQLTDRLDLNADGHLDLVLSNYADLTLASFAVNSYVYWGSTAGPATTKPLELPTEGATNSVAADFNDDGYVDLAFAGYYKGKDYKANSLIYWGDKAGYTVGNVTKLPSYGAKLCPVADLNSDGYLDLAMASYSKDSKFKVNSYIYWGSATGFSASKREELPTQGARGCAVADLNGDGRLDLVFANTYDGGSFKINSYIYWGDASGYLVKKPAELLTQAAQAVTVADLDGDTYLDLVFANGNTGGCSTCNKSSAIFWGSANGTYSSPPTEIPTKGATEISVGRLNSDSYMDLVFTVPWDGAKWKTSSYALMGSSTRFAASTTRTLFDTEGAEGSLIADFNGDGAVDLVFFNAGYKGTAAESVIHWADSKGVSPTGGQTRYKGLRAFASTSNDPGSVYDRGTTQTLTSRALDTGAAVEYLDLTWVALLPKHASLKFQLRSAKTQASLDQATWYGPTSTKDVYEANSAVGSAEINVVHKGDRYIQYRVALESKFYGDTPVLDRVELTYR